MNIRRGDLVDVYVEGGRSVVMVDESVLVLSEIATAILEAIPEVLSSSAALESVTAHVVETFGPPEGATSALEITRQHVFDLVAHKVLVVVEGEDTSRAGGT